jgi:hypothetical protein
VPKSRVEGGAGCQRAELRAAPGSRVDWGQCRVLGTARGGAGVGGGDGHRAPKSAAATGGRHCEAGGVGHHQGMAQ